MPPAVQIAERVTWILHPSVSLFRAMLLKEGQQPNFLSTERGHSWTIMAVGFVVGLVTILAVAQSWFSTDSKLP